MQINKKPSVTIIYSTMSKVYLYIYIKKKYVNIYISCCSSGLGPNTWNFLSNRVGLVNLLTLKEKKKKSSNVDWY